MDLLTKIKGLSYLGFGNLAAAARYGLRRTAWERRWAPPAPRGPAHGPGSLQRAEPRAQGLLLHFEHMELELEFLAPDLLRCTWTPGSLPLPYALDPATVWPPCPASAAPQEGGWVLQTEALRATVAPSGALELHNAAGHLLRREEPPQRAGERWLQRSELPAAARIHGLGERSAPLDLRGRRYRFWNTEPKGAYDEQRDPIYICLPLYLCVAPAASSLVLYENSHDGSLDLRTGATLQFEGGALRSYLIPGPLDRALDRLGQLTGRPALPPRWALGFHQSRWSYGDEAEVRSLAADFRRHDLPLAAIHLDIHYMEGHRVFTVDRRRFPDLAGLARDLEEQGVRLVTILDPGIKADPEYAPYAEGLRAGHFCRLPDGRPVIAPVWPGDCAFPDFSDPDCRRWWGDHYAGLLDQGVAGVWHDMNEPAAFSPWGEPTLPTVTRHSLEGRGGDHREAHNLYALLEARAGFEGLQRHRPERRPWILSRSGWLGLQRYAWTWTGDSESTWWSLRQSLRIALALGLAGMPYSGPDIGGFGGEPDAELFLRWFQLGAVLPFFRVHSAFFTPRREPWAFDEPTLAAARRALLLRERMLPQWYTAAWQAQQHSTPLLRPLFWPAAEEPALLDVDDAFVLGDHLLVAPLVQPGAESRSVPLPRGTWYERATGRRLAGGAPVDLAPGPEGIPLLVRAGAVLPWREGEALVLELWPPAAGQSTVSWLYDDAGDGAGPSLVQRFELAGEGEELELRCRSEGAWTPLAPYRLRLAQGSLRSAEVDGAPQPLRSSQELELPLRLERLRLVIAAP